MRGLAIGVAVLLGLSLVGPVTPAAVADPAVPRGDDWTVEPVAGGFRVTLRLSEPLRIRDALPLITVDGVPVGVARESVDRRTVTVVTTDRRVVRAREVRVRWSGEAEPGAAARSTGSGTDWSRARRGPALPVDPGAPGRYGVDTVEYDLGSEAVYLSGLGHRSEMVGKVYSPRGAVGRRPVVVFLHGRHDFCYGKVSGPELDKPWPCPPGMKPIPSYRGYDAPARALASHGYHVVSISANAINAWDSEALDAGALARAQLVIAHLDQWRRWSTFGGGPFGRRFVGRLNLFNVGLMGHSRGGEGVVRAALLNAERRLPYGVRAVLPLAPTDFARPTLPGVAMSVLLPYCDGDVADLQGQHFYDDSRYAASDQAPRSSVLVMGANHNYFNTEWTPGQSVAESWDDWFTEDDTRGPCGVKHPARLKPLEQQAVGRAYVAGFFRLMLGRETSLQPLLDGSDTRAASAGRAVVRVVAQAPPHARLDLARFDSALPAGSASGGATAQVCAGTSEPEAGAAGKPALPLCAVVGQPWRMPHWVPAWFAPKAQTTTVTRVGWTGPAGVVRIAVPPRQRDVRRYAALTLRAAPDPAARGPLDLTVRVVDGRGRFTDVAVSAVSDALVPMPGIEEEGLPKTILRTVRIPSSSLNELDLRDVRAVELRTNRVRTGSVFVSDLTFSRPSLGFSGPTRLPRLSITDVRIPEGDDGASMNFVVRLSRPSAVPVTFNVDTSGSFDQRLVTAVFRRLRFAPGQTRAVVAVRVKPNDRDSHDQAFSVVLSVPHDAVVGDAFGAGEVIDDDPTPTLFVDHAQAVEHGRVVRFPVRLSTPSDKFAGIFGDLEDGSAVLGRDFLSVYDDGEGEPERDADGFVDSGQTTAWMEVDLIDDNVREPTETFTVPIEVHNAILDGPATLTGTIRDND